MKEGTVTERGIAVQREGYKMKKEQGKIENEAKEIATHTCFHVNEERLKQEMRKRTKYRE
jgi:hypothetical protein